MSVVLEQGIGCRTKHILERLRRVLTAAYEHQARKFAIRRTRRKLSELPDWILRDIGISYGEIEGLAARAHSRQADEGGHWWGHRR